MNISAKKRAERQALVRKALYLNYMCGDGRLRVMNSQGEYVWLQKEKTL